MPGERHLHLRGEDLHLAAHGIVDEHGLGEAELARDRLAAIAGDLRPVQEHPERVAVRAVGGGEDAQHVEGGHPPIMTPGRRPPGWGLSGCCPPRRGVEMPERFKRGDRVEWNFRGRTVTG